jgi:hypothetical protein
MFDISWYANQPLLLIQIDDAFAKQHLTELDKAVLNYYRTTDAPFYLLLDGRLVEQFPSMLVLKDRSWFHDPKLKGIFIYGIQGNKLSMVVRLVFRLIGTPIHLVDSLEAIIAKLKTLDPELASAFEQQIKQAEAEASAPAAQPEIKIEEPPPSIRDTAQLPINDKVMAEAIEQYLINVRGSCEYCQLPTGIRPMHVINTAENAEAAETRMNFLALACEDCIQAKQHRVAAPDPLTGQSVYLFNPRQYSWNDHFAWDDERLEIHGITPMGRATVIALHLNAPERLRLRQVGLQQGWHNPYGGANSSIFPSNGKVRFEIRHASKGVIEKIVLSPEKGLTLGRADKIHKVDVDLMPYAGYRHGVSRLHARITPPQNTALMVVDMASSNGTFINNQQLQPHLPHRLAHGDELRLGQLVIYLYFED